jgi:hypothetical protein
MRHDLDWIRAGDGQCLHRAHVDVFNGLGEQAAKHPDRVHRDRQPARERSEPDGRDEQERPYQVGGRRA